MKVAGAGAVDTWLGAGVASAAAKMVDQALPACQAVIGADNGCSFDELLASGWERIEIEPQYYVIELPQPIRKLRGIQLSSPRIGSLTLTIRREGGYRVSGLEGDALGGKVGQVGASVVKYSSRSGGKGWYWGM
ncbi:hypothetical protein BJV74DRAFT_799664 [Russula compacta]|nr:hypothetical protein BJV74DRAFT_799664 [Russula compacta]